ncbi:MAG: hypothetical protein OXI80_15775 [Caldilineaceae bacterium]|nr:hypothetical protein [Caldilineaceae bacterium]MDE0339129.1 hypothetical protein [Caldilineaceae bacterium]
MLDKVLLSGRSVGCQILYQPLLGRELPPRGRKAKRIVYINDGTIWTWMMVFVCFSRRIEILDWWHMLQYVWQIAAEALGPDSSEAFAWVNAQKAALTRG